MEDTPCVAGAALIDDRVVTAGVEIPGWMLEDAELLEAAREAAAELIRRRLGPDVAFFDNLDDPSGRRLADRLAALIDEHGWPAPGVPDVGR
jgi:hypothetical protein